MKPEEYLYNTNACDAGYRFAMQFDTMKEVWEKCENPSWLLWMLYRKGGDFREKHFPALVIAMLERLAPHYEGDKDYLYSCIAICKGLGGIYNRRQIQTMVKPWEWCDTLDEKILSIGLGCALNVPMIIFVMRFAEALSHSYREDPKKDVSHSNLQRLRKKATTETLALIRSTIPNPYVDDSDKK